jgi:DNA-binding NtrC family response regulator
MEREVILVVEDDPAIAKVVTALLRQDGLEVVSVGSAEDAIARLDAQPFDAVLSDVRLPGRDGLALLEHVSARFPEVPVVLVTAHGSIALAVDAMKRGAADFVQKPFQRDELLFVVRKALEGSHRARGVAPAPETHGFVGDAPAMREVLATIAKVAPSTATVLVRGETGTGKELVARALHEQSPRRKEAFVRVHCAALPDNLLESELFGYEKGAFTGAVQRKPGRIELAHKGTLFLDEIGDISPATQVKLLRVLQERELERLGGTQTIRVDVRVIAATHRNLEDMVAKGTFREDLFYRLAVVPIHVPPLRDRPGDTARLVRHFASAFSDDAVELLAAQPWPGNVRQLQNFVERLVVLADGPVVDRHAVERELARGTSAIARGAASTLEEARKDTEKEMLRRALEQVGNNRTRAARLLEVSRRTLYNKLREHGME